MQIISSPKTLNAILESGFIQNILFGGAPYCTEFKSDKAIGKAVIYLELYQIDINLIKKIKDAGKRVILYHMGDELADKNISAYALCDLVIRNYFFQDMFEQPDLINKILWAPNGYKTGIGPRAPETLASIKERQYLSCFLGWLSNTSSFNGERNLFSEVVGAWRGAKRRRLNSVMAYLKHYFSLSREYLFFAKMTPSMGKDMHVLSSSGFSNGYNVGLYAATMEESVFAPCPAGNSPETIRLYDALECGCIPVLLNHEFLRSPNALAEFGFPPFIFLSSWEEFPQLLEKMKVKIAKHPEEIQKMQHACINWWLNYKINIALKIKSKIDNLC